jgi:hypothetical protein
MKVVMVMCHNSEAKTFVVAIVMIGEGFSNDFSFCNYLDTLKLLERLKCKFKSEDIERGVGVCSLAQSTLRVKKAC